MSTPWIQDHLPMMNVNQHHTPRRPGAGQVALILMILLGVSGCLRRPSVRLITNKPQAAAVLNASHNNRLRLFGDLSNTGPQVYQSRSSISLRQHTFTEVGADADVSIDASGQRMIFSSTRHNAQPDLYIKNVDGVAITQLTADPASDIHPALSPDGRRVAFASHRSGSWDIWIISLEGGPPLQITSGPADDAHPSWSPDGKQLIYCSLPAGGGQWELWLTHTRTNGQKRFIGYGLFPEWSPVSDQIIYQRARERGSRWFSIWRLTLENGEPSYPTELAAGANVAMILPSWSPDGERIVYSSASTVYPVLGNPGSAQKVVMDIWVMSADGRDKIQLTDGFTANYGPAYSTKGRVFFTSNRSGHECIWSVIPPPKSYGLEPYHSTTEQPKKSSVTKVAGP